MGFYTREQRLRFILFNIFTLLALSAVVVILSLVAKNIYSPGHALKYSQIFIFCGYFLWCLIASFHFYKTYDKIYPDNIYIARFMMSMSMILMPIIFIVNIIISFFEFRRE